MPPDQLDIPINVLSRCDQEALVRLAKVHSRNPNLELSEMEQRVAAAIRRRRGDDPVAAAEIVAVTGLTDRAVRNIVRDLVIEHGLPIGSCCACDKPGFFWISDPAELKRAADRHVSFGIVNIVRGRRLYKYNKDELIGQLEAALE